jgi:hypothetical protein
MEGRVAPISGSTAYVVVPDSLFPYEVTLFLMFGGIFITAALYEFRKSLSLAS